VDLSHCSADELHARLHTACSDLLAAHAELARRGIQVNILPDMSADELHALLLAAYRGLVRLGIEANVLADIFDDELDNLALAVFEQQGRRGRNVPMLPRLSDQAAFNVLRSAMEDCLRRVDPRTQARLGEAYAVMGQELFPDLWQAFLWKQEGIQLLEKARQREERRIPKPRKIDRFPFIHQLVTEEHLSDWDEITRRTADKNPAWLLIKSHKKSRKGNEHTAPANLKKGYKRWLKNHPELSDGRPAPG
jgi:hypothetical protein